MPQTRYKKKRVVRGVRNARKRIARKKAATTAYTRISKQPVAERYFTKLAYAEMFNFTITVPSTPFQYSYQTSLHDPDYSSGGHQPLFKDQLYALYNRYRIYGIKYNVELKNTNTSSLAWVYAKHSDNAGSETSFSTMIERKEGHMVTLDSSSGRPARLKGYLSVPKVFGITKQEFIADEDYIGLTVNDATPIKKAFLHFYAVCQTTCVIQALVRMEYYVQFYDRVDVSGS